MDVHVATIGCRLNQFESDAIAARAVELGHRLVASPAEADLCVVNTCTITHAADADSRKIVRRAQRHGARVIVTGCYATAAPEDLAAIPGVERVVANADKVGLFAAAAAPPQPDMTLHQLRRRAPVAQEAPALHPNRSRAYLKIQDGCDYACSFCIVPRVRGASRSLPECLLVDQVRRLVDAGQREIVLTGVHIGTYGRDLCPRSDLVELLHALLPHLAGARLRLSSLDPHEVSDRLIGLIADNPHRICRHLHLPVQSGDAGILATMRRAHTVEDIRRTVARLSAAVDGIGIGSDIIVGFPTETEVEFAGTEALITELPFTYLHVFTYSERSGTDAVRLPGSVAPQERKRRNRVLRRLSARKAAAFAERLLDSELPALILDERHPASGEAIAVTDNYIRVRCATDAPPRTWIRIRLTAVADDGGPHPAVALGSC